MTAQSEKRQRQRQPFSFPVRLELSDRDRGTFELIRQGGEGVDISSDGIGIRADHYIEPGQVVKVFLPLGTAETLIPSFSEVRWISPAGESYRLGLQFIV